MLAGSGDRVYAGPRVRVRRGRRAKLPVSTGKSVRREGGRGGGRGGKGDKYQ